MADLHELNTSSGLDTKDIKESKFMMQLSADAVTLQKQIEALKNKPESKYELAQKEHELRTIEYRLKGHNFGDLKKQCRDFLARNYDQSKVFQIIDETGKMISEGKEINEFPHLAALFLIKSDEAVNEAKTQTSILSRDLTDATRIATETPINKLSNDIKKGTTSFVFTNPNEFKNNKKVESGLEKKQIESAIAYNNKYSKEQIKQIQKNLDPKNENPNGLIDDVFIESVRAWQTLNGLKSDGKVGPATFKALEVKFNKTTKNEKGESAKKESSNSQSNKTDTSKKTTKAKEKALEKPQLPEYAKQLEVNLKEFPLKTAKEVVENKFNGKATILYNNGVIQGEFNDSKILKGKIYSKKFNYEGLFKDGLMHGDGKYLSLNNGSSFKGEFKDGEMYNGDLKGGSTNLISVYKDGTEYKADLSNGEFTKIFPEKAIYVLNKEVGTSFVYDVNSNINPTEGYFSSEFDIGGQKYYIKINKSNGEISLNSKSKSLPIETGADKVITKLKKITTAK